MTRVFIADTRTEERFALQLLLRQLNLDVVGEAADWATTLAQAPVSGTEMLLVDWDVLPSGARAALDILRKACPPAMAVVLISRLDAREQAAESSGADTFVSKVETAERMANHLLAVAANIRTSLVPREIKHLEGTDLDERQTLEQSLLMTTGTNEDEQAKTDNS